MYHVHVIIIFFYYEDDDDDNNVHTTTTTSVAYGNLKFYQFFAMKSLATTASWRQRFESPKIDERKHPHRKTRTQNFFVTTTRHTNTLSGSGAKYEEESEEAPFDLCCIYNNNNIFIAIVIISDDKNRFNSSSGGGSRQRERESCNKFNGNLLSLFVICKINNIKQMNKWNLVFNNNRS